MKKRHFTRLSAFALAAALSVITASTPFSDAFPITASVTVSAADETAEGGSTSSQNEVTFTVSGGTPGFANEGPEKLIDGKYTKDNSNNKNKRNNGKGNRQDRKPKKEGLNLSGLAKFMH